MRAVAGTLIGVAAAILGLCLWAGESRLRLCEAECAALAATLEELSGEQPAYRERVVQLPEDAGTWWLTLVYHDKDRLADAGDRRLAGMLAGTPELASLEAQTKVVVYEPGDRIYDERLAATFGQELPAIRLQQPDGRVCYQAAGRDMPTSGLALAEEIIAAIEQCRPRPPDEGDPRERRPRRVVDQVIPNLRPRPRGTDLPLGALLIVPFVAALGGAYFAYRRSS